MGKVNVSKAARSIRAIMVKRSPEILTGLGITGMLTTTVLAVKATPKAVHLIEVEIAKQNHDRMKESAHSGQDTYAQIGTLPPLEVIKLTWKCYIPAAITCVASMVCLIGASSVSLRRNAALATAYKISETALSEYRNAVVETIGEKKERVVRDNQAKTQVENNPVTNTEVIITEKGNTLCYDMHFDRYFKSDIETIRRAVNEINKTLLNEIYVSLNDFYDELGLKHTPIGDELGWSSDKGLIEIHFSSQIADDGTPCIVIVYDTPPFYGYSSLY